MWSFFSVEFGVWSVEFRSGRQFCLKNTFVPDCIINELIFFAINRRVAPMCATYP